MYARFSLVLLCAFAFISPTSPARAQSSGRLEIKSPRGGEAITPGRPLVVTVQIASGAFPKGVAVFAWDPLGNTDVQPVTRSTLSFTLQASQNIPPASYQITAVGVDSSNPLVSSPPVTVNVPDIPSYLFAKSWMARKNPIPG